MKKFLIILILNLFLISSSANAGPIGRGELKLKPTAVDAFIKYIQMKDKPGLFLVPIDGSSAYMWKCPKNVQCVSGGYTRELEICERYFNKDCKVFAKRRTVKWSNGINKGKKESKFHSKMSASEIKSKLAELGFLRASAVTTTTSKKKKSNKGNISKELKELNELYKSGVLTKEEFEKAKKKLLN
tara:strand:+ start:3695 stop:4252 length:558 start_codon:yes stop_codon:yes gene_type:complete